MEKLSNSKFENFKANELSNMDNIQGGLKYILLVVISFSFIFFSCEQNEMEDHNVKDDISAYMSYVNKAELNLIADQLDSAFLNYQHAFANLKSIYAKDLCNASIVCFKLNKKDKGLLLLKQLFEKGVSINEIEQSKYYQAISQKDKGLWQTIINLGEETDISESISTELFNQMDSLYQMDVLFRNKIRPNPYPVYGDTIEQIDISNFEFLLNTNKSGFPSEERIGTHDLYGYLPHYLVIHHNFQYSGSKCNQILDSALNKEQIHPYYYSYLHDIGHKKFIGDFGNYALHDLDKNLIRELKGDLKEKINNNRSQIGLSSIDDYYTKVEYVLAGKKEYLFHVNTVLDPREMLPPKPSSN